MRNRTLVLVCALFGSVTPLAGQSLFSSVGLGLPVEAVDGRARALGNLGVGLDGAGFLPTNPAVAARALLPSGILVAQPSWSEASDGAETNYYNGTRFPLLAVTYPVLGGVASVHFTSHLDQDFSGERETSLTVGSLPVVARDAFEQDGAVSSVNAGFARVLTGETAVGLTVGRYTGSVERVLTRTLGTSSESSAVQPYVSSGSWSYSGYIVTGSVASRLLDLVEVAVGATWSTELEAEATGTSQAGDATFGVPLRLRIGASAALAPGLTLSASAARADWSSVSNDLSGDEEARATLAFGAGIELSQARLLGRQAPLRLGFRRSDLPFSVSGEDASERVFSGGVGLVLAQAGDVMLANVDVAVERGRRKGGALTENFWRATLSVSVAGL